MRTLAVAILLPLALSACAASVTSRGLAAQARTDTILETCQQDVESTGIDTLSHRTNWNDSSSISLWMLSLDKVATPEEKEVIARLWDSVQKCGETFVEFLASDLNGEIAALWRLDVNRQLLQLAALYNGDVTWGAFNKDLRRYDSEFRLQYAIATKNYWNREYAKAEQRQAAVGAALQAYGNALKNYGNTYAASANRAATVPQMPIYDPVRTSCRENGNSVTCTQTSNLMTAPKIIKCRVNGSVMTCTEQ